jgi:CheY-like chemotaxis protein
VENTMMGAAVPLNSSSRLGGVRVLVVDDEPDVRYLVTEVLMRDGAKVTAVASAEEALATLQGERPDVLLSDLVMPGRGGYWLIGQVRALPRQRGGTTPAVAVTGQTGQRAGVLGAGFQFYVPKPIDVEARISAVATLALKYSAPARPSALS